jgi:hypothetical protein
MCLEVILFYVSSLSREHSEDFYGHSQENFLSLRNHLVLPPESDTSSFFQNAHNKYILTQDKFRQ